MYGEGRSRQGKTEEVLFPSQSCCVGCDGVGAQGSKKGAMPSLAGIRRREHGKLFGRRPEEAGVLCHRVTESNDGNDGMKSGEDVCSVQMYKATTTKGNDTMTACPLSLQEQDRKGRGTNTESRPGNLLELQDDLAGLSAGVGRQGDRRRDQLGPTPALGQGVGVKILLGCLGLGWCPMATMEKEL